MPANYHIVTENEHLHGRTHVCFQRGRNDPLAMYHCSTLFLNSHAAFSRLSAKSNDILTRIVYIVFRI